jgi:formylglycine-generating enzyme required for sulfatase activity
MIILFVFVLIFLPDISISAKSQKTALVIGNGAYSSSPLRNPVNDASDIASALKKLGFKVLFKTDANQRTMKKFIRTFGKELRSGGVGLFYYAGHAMQVHGTNYLIPIGAQIESESDVEYEAIDAGRVLGKMEDAGNGLNIIILDACRDNPFTRSFRTSEKGLARMDAPTGSILAYATAPGSIAADGTGRNGLYTSKLLKHMTTPGLEIEKVFKKVRIDVLRSSNKKQVPWESSSLIGEFYFNPKRGIAIVGSTPKIDSGLKAEQEQLEQERNELERIEAEIEERKTVEAERKRIEAKKEKLLAMSKRPPKSKSKKINSLGMEFVYIKPSTFMMGSPSSEEGQDSDERQHRVTLTKGFYMQTTEVTIGQWRRFVSDTGYRSEAETQGGAWIWTGKKWEKKKGYYWDKTGFSQNDNQPVTCVSWNDVQKYIGWLNRKEGTNRYRLPTEAEWEYTARAGSTTAFANGGISELKCGYDSNLDAMGWYCGNSNKRTHPVAQKQRNAWGLYDMHGNVWEWCQDWYGKNYPVSSVVDPTGPSSGSIRVIRGGSWNRSARFCRSANRGSRKPGYRNGDLGFRLAFSQGQ